MTVRSGARRSWWEGWASLGIVAALTFIGVVFGFWPKGVGWRITGALAIGIATVLWAAREVVLTKRREAVAELEQRAAIAARKQTVDSARTAIVNKDTLAFFRDMCRQAESHFAPREVRVGVYVLEPNAIDEETQDESYSLTLYGENVVSRGMSKTVDPNDPRGSHKKMVERALGRVPLTVEDVRERCLNWEPVDATADQRRKYMSFISVPIEMWDESALTPMPTPMSGPPAGLLCIDCRRTASDGGLAEADEDLVHSLALVMSIGLNTLLGRHRVAIPNQPRTSRTPSVGRTSVRVTSTSKPARGGRYEYE